MRCPSCGKRGAATARYCDRCGTALARTAADRERGAQPADGQASSPTGDRRIVTALFADLVDYVRMLAEHDPEEVRARVTIALATMADTIERLEGTREKFIGDAVFAVFGWPRAHDDDAVRGALAALMIRARLREIGDGVEPMEVRIGIATGEVVTTADRPGQDGDLGLTGQAITTAARIQSLAQPGQILLDEATRRAARDRLATEPRGSVVLRGQSTAVELHDLWGEAGASPWVPYRTHASGPIVGRTTELAIIKGAIERVRRTGTGEALVIVGEAGMGKSRLLAATEDMATAAGFAWTWTENLPFRRREPYRWIRLFAQTVADEHGLDSGTLTRRLLFTDDLPPETVRRFGGAIAAIARDVSFAGWERESADMPTDPAIVAATLIEVGTLYLDRLIATSGPRVIVIDDLHFIDASSVGMVDLVVAQTMGRPLLVLAGLRPGPMPDWIDRPGVRRIDLDGLDEPDTARLATDVAEAALDVADARRIHERTAGNPLFVGETVRAFLDDGTLVRRDGRVTLTGVAPSRLPVTLRAVLGARIDSLEPDERHILGVASVVGVAFEASALAGVLGVEPAQGVLERLTAGALIAPAGEGRWRFAHALIRDAAYEGLLASRRRLLHARLADHLEAEPGPPAPGRVGVHRAAAGEIARALPHLREAAASALALGALQEAAAFWRQAADLAADIDAEGAAADRARADAIDPTRGEVTSTAAVTIHGLERAEVDERGATH
ncbi:MAG: ATP-binding protein [Candidatus Limnocylindrales bacterium]